MAARSLVSDAPVARVGVIEAGLWQELPFITPPWCAACGVPFQTPEPDDALCPACVIEPPAFAPVRAPPVYDGAVRKLALERKHAARRDGLKLFAQWMAAAAGAALAKADMIVPVPLQWTRLALRGFNQAGWLAAALARQASKPMRQDVSASQAPPQPRRAEPQTAPGQWRRRLSRRRPGRWPRHPGGG